MLFVLALNLPRRCGLVVPPSGLAFSAVAPAFTATLLTAIP